MTPQSIRGKLQQIRDDLTAQFLERKDVVDAMLAAILAEQHIVLLGEAGIAKTAAAEAFIRRVTGALYFKRLMRRDSCPDEVLGAMSVKGLENDEFRRVLDPAGGLHGNRVANAIRAHIALFDEAFKANSTVLNGMLDVINERTFQNGGVEEKCNLISAFLLSNEKPEKEELAAFWDRCVVRMVVKDIQEKGNFAQFLDMKAGNVQVTDSGTMITLDELRLAIADVKQVTIKTDVTLQIAELREKLHELGLYPSPRRFAFILRYLQAVAWLDGRNEVAADDLMELVNCFWEREEDIPNINAELGKLASPELGQIIEMLDNAKEVSDNANVKDVSAAKLVEANTKLRTARQKIEAIAKNTKSPKAKAKATEAIQKIKGWHKNLVSKLGLDTGDL